MTRELLLLLLGRRRFDHETLRPRERLITWCCLKRERERKNERDSTRENERKHILKREKEIQSPQEQKSGHISRVTTRIQTTIISRTNHPKRGKNPHSAPLRELHRRCSRRDDIHVRGGPVRARDERFQYFSHLLLCWRKRRKMWSVLGYRALSKCVITTWSYSSDSDSITRNSPCSYRQPSGKGQSLSRRYCKHSV